MAIRKMHLPIKGYSAAFSAEDQPTFTTQHILNVRIPDSAEKQIRASKRPGLTLAFATAAGALNYPVVECLTVTVVT